jgi:Spy/CpxP family protein refolding chaperone
MKTNLLLNTVLCSLILFTFAISQDRERPKDGPKDGRMMGQLNLSDSQKKDVEKLNSDFAKQRVEQQAKIKIASIDLHSLMKSESPDKGAIEKKIGEISDLKAQNRILGVDHWFSVNRLLNPDQQKVWKHMLDRPLRERFAARMRQMRDRTMGRSHKRPMPPESHQ